MSTHRAMGGRPTEPSQSTIQFLGKLSVLGLVACAGAGCSKGPAAPFDTLKGSNVIAYRLQNYEPAPGQAAAPGAGGLLPGIPPEIQQWVQQGAQGLSQLLPPGLLPPGLVNPGAPPPQADAARFHGFRILSQTQVLDPKVQESLAEIFGDADHFHNQHSACAYSEMGISFSPQPGVTNDLLISFSCNQVVSQTFAWPYRSAGMKPDTVKQLSETVQKIWPPGT